MIFKLQIDKNCEESVTAQVHERTALIDEIERLPKAFAGLIQGLVLYIDYLGFYLLNGWIPVNKIWIFTIIFVVGFLVIWLSIYIPIRIKVSRMNKMLKL